MKRIASFLLPIVLLLSLALPVAAEESEIPYDVYLKEPGSYTAIDSQTFWWTAPENGTFTFTIDSETNWSFGGYVGGYGIFWGEYGNEENTSSGFTVALEAGATVSLGIGYVSDNDETGTVDFTFAFVPDGTGTGGYILESTHQTSGDGSWEAPYTYATIEDFLADWTNRKIGEADYIYICAPLGGETLTINSRYTRSDMTDYEPYKFYCLDIPYEKPDGKYREWGHTFLEGNGSYTFDAAAFEEAAAAIPDDCTLLCDPWAEGDMITFCMIGAASSPYFMVLDMTVASHPYPGGNEEYNLGDVNGDGEIDILDANLVVAWYNEIRELDEEALAAADVNGDGEVDIMDANMIVAYYNEVIDSFPANS